MTILNPKSFATHYVRITDAHTRSISPFQPRLYLNATKPLHIDAHGNIALYDSAMLPRYAQNMRIYPEFMSSLVCCMINPNLQSVDDTCFSQAIPSWPIAPIAPTPHAFSTWSPGSTFTQNSETLSPSSDC